MADIIMTDHETPAVFEIDPIPIIKDADDEHRSTIFFIVSGEDPNERLESFKDYWDHEEDNIDKVKFVLLRASVTSCTPNLASLRRSRIFLHSLIQKEIYEYNIRSDLIMIVAFGFSGMAGFVAALTFPGLLAGIMWCSVRITPGAVNVITEHVIPSASPRRYECATEHLQRRRVSALKPKRPALEKGLTRYTPSNSRLIMLLSHCTNNPEEQEFEELEIDEVLEAENRETSQQIGALVGRLRRMGYTRVERKMVDSPDEEEDNTTETMNMYLLAGLDPIFRYGVAI